MRILQKIFHCECSSTWGNAAPLVLRLAAGLIFVVHGWQKTQGLDQFGGFLGSLGVPLPEFFAVVVMLVELLGGIALLAGLFTHWASKLLAIDMLTATLLVHAKNGFLVSDGGIEFTLLLFSVVVALMITGAGQWSLDHRLRNR